MTAGLLAVTFGVLMLTSIFIPEFTPSKSMDKMPWPIIALISGFLGSGGLLAVIGLNWSGDNVSTGWGLEQFGWWLAAGGFATFAISVSWHYPGSVFSWGIPLGLGAGSAVRAISIIMIERGVRRTLKNLESHTHE